MDRNCKPGCPHCNTHCNATSGVELHLVLFEFLLARCRRNAVTPITGECCTKIFFSFLSLLIGWQLSIWKCCKPFFSLLYYRQLLCFWRFTLSIVVEVFPQPSFRVLLLQECLLQTSYAQLYALSMSRASVF